jgi:hypothetical protein
MPLPGLAFIAYAALFALTSLARLRYRTLAGLLLVAAGALAATFAWLGNAKAHLRAPIIAKQAIAALHAQPWPASAQDLARLVASFRALGDVDDESAARFAYARAVEREIAGDPPLAFKSVDEGLAWIQSLPPHNRKFPEWREVEEIRQRVISRIIEVRFADTSAGWPSNLENAYALKPGSRLIARGLWAANPDPSDRLISLQYALQVRNLGQGKIIQADVNYREKLPPDADSGRGAARPRTFCSVHIVNLDAGESSYSKCSVQTFSLDTPQAARQLEHLDQLRAGAVVLEPMLGGSFKYTLTDPPQAEPFSNARAVEFAEQKTSDAARVRTQGRVRQQMGEWLIVLAVLGAGFALPGIRRRPIGLLGTFVLAVAGAAAILTYTSLAFTSQGMEKGWVPVIAFFVSLFYDAVLVGGVLLANLALQQRTTRR